MNQFVPGDKVTPLTSRWEGRFYPFKAPVENTDYTVRALTTGNGLDGILLEEVRNGDHLIDDEVEPSFDAQQFQKVQ
jgi:hypothetical protein